MTYRVQVLMPDGTRRYPVVVADSAVLAKARAVGIWSGGKAGLVDPWRAPR